MEKKTRIKLLEMKDRTASLLILTWNKVGAGMRALTAIAMKLKQFRFPNPLLHVNWVC